MSIRVVQATYPPVPMIRPGLLVDRSSNADRIAPPIRQTILIVDDAPIIVASLISTLGNEFEILAANDGREAMRIANLRLPDLILLDTFMPDSDGFEICHRLKLDERTRDIPVIFLTGADATDDEIRCLELGAIDFLSKPFEPRIVGMRVRNYLELKRYRNFLENLALVDGLTGIGNRKRLNDALYREWRRARRVRAPLSLAIVDIDHFKSFNDEYGHAAGDDCLRRIATILLETVRRPADLAARFDAEEFAAVLPQTTNQGAIAVAERIRRGVTALAIPHARSAVAPCVTISIGVGTLPADSEESPESLLDAAIIKLKQAKLSGRNQVL